MVVTHVQRPGDLPDSAHSLALHNTPLAKASNIDASADETIYARAWPRHYRLVSKSKSPSLASVPRVFLSCATCLSLLCSNFGCWDASLDVHSMLYVFCPHSHQYTFGLQTAAPSRDWCPVAHVRGQRAISANRRRNIKRWANKPQRKKQKPVSDLVDNAPKKRKQDEDAAFSRDARPKAVLIRQHQLANPRPTSQQTAVSQQTARAARMLGHLGS